VSDPERAPREVQAVGAINLQAFRAEPAFKTLIDEVKGGRLRLPFHRREQRLELVLARGRARSWRASTAF
jgi:hypothetical protein